MKRKILFPDKVSLSLSLSLARSLALSLSLSLSLARSLALARGEASIDCATLITHNPRHAD